MATATPTAARRVPDVLAFMVMAFLIWGLRPQTPYTLSRGAPTIPAPFAWLSR
jgi:hypothetical protein